MTHHKTIFFHLFLAQSQNSLLISLLFCVFLINKWECGVKILSLHIYIEINGNDYFKSIIQSGYRT